MRVTMRTNITGYRNGAPWPAPGESIDLPDSEAAGLVANGYAKEATDEGPAEHDDQAPDVDDVPGPGADDASAPADEPAQDDDEADSAPPAEQVADDPSPDVDSDPEAPAPVKRPARKQAAKPKG